MTSIPHLWVALSPHGFGHAAMTAPVVAELRRRWPGMRLTVQTSLPVELLRSRYGAFDLVAEIPDFGFRMVSSTEVDVAASAAAYAAQHRDFDGLVEWERARLEAAAPDLVLANVPYVVCEAAGRAGIPVVALSSLNWADMFAHYLPSMPDADGILAQIRAAYAKASVFLRCTPAQEMTLPNLRDIGVVAAPGRNRRAELAQALGVGEGGRIGLVAFGGIDHRLPMEDWPAIPGWTWLHTIGDCATDRPDLKHWEGAGLEFSDLIPSVDVLVTKPGYGTFTEAGLAGTPVLYVPRPGWPECPHIDRWLERHTRAMAVGLEDLFGHGLAPLLHKLLERPSPGVATASGVVEAADVIEGVMGWGK